MLNVTGEKQSWAISYKSLRPSNVGCMQFPIASARQQMSGYSGDVKCKPL